MDTKPSGPGTGLMGTLTQMSMTDVMQMLDISKKSARIEVHFDGREGIVHVREGQIVRAVVDNGAQVGEDAFLVLCRQRDGLFRIQFGQEAIEPNVHRPTTFVLLEALRVIDEESNQPEEQQPAVPAPVEERKQEHRRYAVSMPVELTEEGGRVTTLSLGDISLGGAFVLTHEPLPRGTAVTLRLMASHEPMTLGGRIVHTLDAAHARGPGMGVQFEGVSTENHARLERFIDQLAEDEIMSAAGASQDGQRTEQILNLVAEADFLLATGDRDDALRVLHQAAALAPDDEDVGRRIAALDDTSVTARAAQLLDVAERETSKARAAEQARSAARMCPERAILLRALNVCHRADASTDVVSIAEELLQLNPRDELALRALLDVNVAARRWPAAARAGEALLRLRPDDLQLRELLKQIVASARRRGASQESA